MSPRLSQDQSAVLLLDSIRTALVFGFQRRGVRDVVALPEPVPCRGAQGLWTVPPEALERVRARWRAAKEVGCG